MISTNEKTIGSASELESWRRALARPPREPVRTVRVCIGTGCAAKGSRRLYELFREAAGTSGANVKVQAKCVGCHGLCERGPIVVVQPGDILYQSVSEPSEARSPRRYAVTVSS